MSARPIAVRRLAAQRLVGAHLTSPAAVVRHLLAVQSQDYPNAKWAIAQRLAGDVVDADVDRAIDAGELVRTHVMRPTWHFVAPGDLRWLLQLTATRVHQASAVQYRQLELDPATRARGRTVIEQALRGETAMTREELGEVLRDRGLYPDGLRLTYLVMDAELEGVICSGPRRGKRHTYVLLEKRLPPARPRLREEALAELGRRYVEGHGPAQVADLAWWSGLTVADARAALESATPPLVREVVGPRVFFASPEEAPPTAESPVLHLLPNYDELLVAFRDRNDALDPELPPQARVAQVILSHVITRDGLVVGSYRRRDEGRRVRLELTPLVELDDGEQAGIRGAVQRFASFIRLPVEVGGLD